MEPAMTISVTDTATGTELTVTEVRAALNADTPLLAALQAEREGKPVATWAEFDEGLTELRRRLIDGLGEADAVLSAGQPEPEPEPVQWAELPEGEPPFDRGGLLPAGMRAELIPDAMTQFWAAADPDPRPGRWVNVAEDDLLPARIVRVGDVKLPRRNDTFERRFVPDPADYGPRPADHGPVDRWLERTEQRLRAWWAGKQAQRDERMGVEQ